LGDPESDDETWADDEDDEVALASELLEQVGRDASTLVLREVQLATSHHIPELRRAGRDLAILVAAIASLAAAFALANWAAVAALSSPLPGWRAPLLVAAVWGAVGALLAAFVLARTGNLLGTTWRRALLAEPAEIVRIREQARDEAEQVLRDSLGEFAGAVASEAGALVADAVVPLASDAVDIGEDVLDTFDDVTDAIEERVPGGGVINQVADLMLLPGRYVLKVVGTRVEPDQGEEESANDEA
jgi:hypothetical protein